MNKGLKREKREREIPEIRGERGQEGGGLRERTEGRMDDVFTEEKSCTERKI